MSRILYDLVLNLVCTYFIFAFEVYEKQQIILLLKLKSAWGSEGELIHEINGYAFRFLFYFPPFLIELNSICCGSKSD